MVKIKVRSRIKDDSYRYKTETFIPTEILNGTKVDLVKLDYYDYYAIFCRVAKCQFLGPRGPLRVPMSVHPSTRPPVHPRSF